MFNLDSLSTKLVDFRRYCSTFRDGCGRTGKREQKYRKEYKKNITMTNTTSYLPWGHCRATFKIFGLNNIKVTQLPKPEVMKTFELQATWSLIIGLSLIFTLVYKWILKSAFELRIPFASAAPLGLASAVIRYFNHPEPTNKVFYCVTIFFSC